MSKMGVWTVDITPPLGIDFIGYHREGGIQDILDRIYGTALVFEKDEEKIVLINVDNIGLLVEDTTLLRERIAKELKISRDKVTVVYTHTHSGPETEGKDPVQQAYKTLLFENLFRTAIKANEKLQPCEIGWGLTHGNIGVNRREVGKDGKVFMGTNPKGVVDRRIGVLSIRHNVTHELLSIMVFCTAHPNVLRGDSFLLSGDYPGFTREILQEILGCPVVILQGGTGNVNAKWRGSQEHLEKVGHALSGHVLTVLPEIEYSSIKRLRSKSSFHSMRLKRVPEPDEIMHMAEFAETEWGVNTTKWKNVLLEKYKNDNRDLTINLEVQLLQFNEGAFSGIPMEPFSETAIEIKDRLENDYVFFGGYTNGYLGYLPHREAYPYGGYEVEINPVVYGPETGLWMPPCEDTAEQIVKEVLKMYR